MGPDRKEHSGFLARHDNLNKVMEYSFPRYLLSKQTVDDRALNKDVLNALTANLPSRPIRIIEAGAGIGTMLTRLVRWGIIHEAEYVMVDEMAENIAFAQEWIPQWAMGAGLSVERVAKDQLRVFDQSRNVRIHLERAEVFDFIQRKPASSDLLITNAFLDLLPMPESLPKLLILTNSLAWLTITFDGVTTFEPTIDAALDEQIERLYHETMDTRPTGGDSRSGRHLFRQLKEAGVEILAAGASDWVVYTTDGKYSADEAYFLRFILHFLESALSNHPALDAAAFEGWLSKRHEQIVYGELVYIAHQMDFLVRV